jgi:uncharacterized membrane protein
MADEARIDLLRSVLLFHGLSDVDLASLANGCVERWLVGGTVIFNRGDVGSTMYIIVQGQVNIHLPDQGSRRMSLNDMARGEYFGEVALFDDLPRTASASALTDVALLELSRPALVDFLKERPSAALTMLRTMSSRVRNMTALLEDQVSRNAVAEFEMRLTWSDRLADKVAEMNGSWAFILALVALTGVWVLVNTLGLMALQPFDQYPFVFFNLLLAVLVGLQGPLILMSQNRESAKDRATAEMDFTVNLKNEVNIQTLVRELGEFRLETVARVEDIERVVTAMHGKISG